MYDVRGGPSNSYHYSDETIEEESLSTGNAQQANFTGTLAYTPVRSGTLLITDGSQRATDDGNGNLVGDVNPIGVNTISYANGTYDVTFLAAPAAGDAITATYEYNKCAPCQLKLAMIMGLIAGRLKSIRDMLISSQADRKRLPVVGRGLKVQRLMGEDSKPINPTRAPHSLSLRKVDDIVRYSEETQRTEIKSSVKKQMNEIAKELNYKIIRHIRQIASAGAVTWNRTPPQGVPWIWHKESSYDALVEASNLIFQATQRAVGNWIVAATNVCNVLETISKFKIGRAHV